MPLKKNCAWYELNTIFGFFLVAVHMPCQKSRPS